MTMTISPTRNRQGQAAVETAIGLTVFAFVVMALIGFADIFLKGFDQLVDVRTEAGLEALTARDGELAGGQPTTLKQTTEPKTADWRRAPAAATFSTAWDYPNRIFGGDSALSTWRQTSSPFVHKRAFRTEEFDLDLSLLGSGLFFPDSITLKETALMPVMGGTQ